MSPWEVSYCEGSAIEGFLKRTLSLWVFVYLGIVWDKHQRDPQNAVPAPVETSSTKPKQAPRAVALTRKNAKADAPLLALEQSAPPSRRAQRTRSSNKNAGA